MLYPWYLVAGPYTHKLFVRISKYIQLTIRMTVLLVILFPLLVPLLAYTYAITPYK